MRELQQLQRQEWESIAQTNKNPLEAAKQALERGDTAEAARNWEMATIRFPTVVRSAPDSLHVLLGLERYDEAEALIRDGQRLTPSEPYFAEALAQVSERRGEPEKAVQCWERARRRFPHRPENYWKPAKLLSQIGLFDEADDILRAAAGRFPQNFLCLSAYASIAQQRERWPEALRRWQMVLDAFEHNSDENRSAILGAAGALQKMGRFDEAEELIMSRWDSYQFHLEFRIALARLSSDAGDWPTAVKRWGEMRKGVPANPIGYVEEARALRNARRISEAGAVIDEALSRFPDNATVASEMALVDAERLAETNEAREVGRALSGGIMGGEPAEPLERRDESVAIALGSDDTSVTERASHLRFVESLVLRFGTSGNAVPYLTYGWSLPEDGYTFAVDGETGLSLPGFSAPFGLVLEITLHPFVHPERLPEQRILIRVNGQTIGHSSISEFKTIAFLLPAHLAASYMHVTFEQPNAARPTDVTGSHDTRCLGFAFHEIRVHTIADSLLSRHASRRDTISLRHLADIEAIETVLRERTNLGRGELVKEFESLGDNCEFGLFQRSYDAEPLGLFRFSTVNLPPLLRGIRMSFAGLDVPADILPVLEDTPKEWLVYQRQYQLRYHTFKREHEATETEIRAREVKRLGFLRRKLLTDLESSAKIFVYKREKAIEFEEILPLFVDLNEHGLNTLLWVVPARAPYEPGTVEELLPGLLRGHIDKLPSTHTPGDLSQIGWLEICVSAYCLGCRHNAPVIRGDAVPL